MSHIETLSKMGCQVALLETGKLVGKGFTDESRGYLASHRAAVLLEFGELAFGMLTEEYVGSGFWMWLDELYQASDSQGKEACKLIEGAVLRRDIAKVEAFCLRAAGILTGSELYKAVQEVFEGMTAGVWNFGDV